MREFLRAQTRENVFNQWSQQIHTIIASRTYSLRVLKHNIRAPKVKQIDVISAFV